MRWHFPSIQRVILPYAATAALWFSVVDWYFSENRPMPALLARLIPYEGLAFVLGTSVLLYWLLRREFRGRKRAENERQRLSARIHEILESITDGFVALDKDWRYVYVNRRAAEMFERKPEDLLGRHIWTEFPEGVDQPFYRAYHQAMAQQVPISTEDFYAPWGRWFENRIYPSPETLHIFFREITERKRAEIWQEGQHRVLAQIVAGKQLGEVLSTLVLATEPLMSSTAPIEPFRDRRNGASR
jgi:PAS domain S-box-containing protein